MGILPDNIRNKFLLKKGTVIRTEIPELNAKNRYYFILSFNAQDDFIVALTTPTTNEAIKRCGNLIKLTPKDHPDLTAECYLSFNYPGTIKTVKRSGFFKFYQAALKS